MAHLEPQTLEQIKNLKPGTNIFGINQHPGFKNEAYRGYVVQYEPADPGDTDCVGYLHVAAPRDAAYVLDLDFWVVYRG